MDNSRLRLTLLEHQGAIWNVHLSTVRDAPAHARMRLEFEPIGDNPAGIGHSRPLSGSLWSALQEGRPVRRSDLTEELEQALGERVQEATAVVNPQRTRDGE